MGISVFPVTPTFAAEIGDLDLRRPLALEDMEAVRGAFATYAVLTAHATQRQFVYTHRWRVGDLRHVGQPLHHAPRHGVRRHTAAERHAESHHVGPDRCFRHARVRSRGRRGLLMPPDTTVHGAEPINPPGGVQ